jgi:predicted nucleic acid-binding Zn ribbon protein
MTDVRVYVAEGCHLCGPALEVVRNVCGDQCTVVSITGNPELERRYRERIPVVEIDGVERFRFEVDEHALRAAVSGISA